MKYQTFEHVLLALQLSDIFRDWIETWSGKKVTLIFKKFYKLNKSLEFRLFVKEGKLRGICQRNLENRFEFLKGFYEERGKEAILRFFEEVNPLISLADCSLKRLPGHLHRLCGSSAQH